MSTSIDLPGEAVVPPGTLELLVERTLRVPAFAGDAANSCVVVRQLDIALLAEDFVAPAELLAHLAGLADAGWYAGLILAALGRRRGAHSPFFRGFPHEVPPTEHFWTTTLIRAQLLAAPTRAIELDLEALPHYGRYPHSFAEMLARRAPAAASRDEHRTLLQLGDSPGREAWRAYTELLGATVPLVGPDLELLGALAGLFVQHPLPSTAAAADSEAAPGAASWSPGASVRENRAVVDAARMAAGGPLVLVSTVTDVLRVAAYASGGDIGLVEPSRLRSFTRRERRSLLAALDRIVAAQPSALVDVAGRRERWKRLGERLHPHEHAARWPHAARVFAVARGEQVARSAVGRAELALAADDPVTAARALASTPGVLLRWADRLLRRTSPQQLPGLLEVLADGASGASGRVLCALHQHLDNVDLAETRRLFVNRRGPRAHTAEDTRPPLPPGAASALAGVLDVELSRRLPDPGVLLVDPAVRALALPITGKPLAVGEFAVMPPGSMTTLEPDAATLRIELSWREALYFTDYELSVLCLDDDFAVTAEVSPSRPGVTGVLHSAGLVEALAHGEAFVDVDLAGVAATHLVVQVGVIEGEAFTRAASSWIGYRTYPARLAHDHRGPAVPTGSRGSALRAGSRFTLPVMFSRRADGAWQARWTGHETARRWRWDAETIHRGVTNTFLQQTVSRRVLTVGYLLAMLEARADRVIELVFPAHGAGPEGDGQAAALAADLAAVSGPITYVGRTRPAGLPAHAELITLDRLHTLVPA